MGGVRKPGFYNGVSGWVTRPLRGFLCLLQYWGWGLETRLLEGYMCLLQYWGVGLGD